MPNRKPIVVVGSINMDLVAVTERIPAVGETVIGTDLQMHPGGKGANQAVAIARLGYPVQMVGLLGTDAFGSELRKHLQTAGVDTAGVGTHEGSSGAALIAVSAKGENSIIVASGSNSKVTPEYLEQNLALIREAGMVLTQLEIPLETIEYLAATCARLNVPLVLDPAPAANLPSAVFTAAHWFTPNEREASFYATQNGAQQPKGTEETARRLLEMGCRRVALKLGSSGVYLASEEDKGEFVPAFQVQAVDTTAAGDAFNGAFAVGLMMGGSSRESAVFAAAVAAISVTRMGAQPSMPLLAEVQSFMTEHSVTLSKTISHP